MKKPVDVAEAIAEEFILEQVEEYDYDLIKEFIYDKMAEEGNFFTEVYSERVSEVCDAMKRAKVIVKFSR